LEGLRDVVGQVRSQQLADGDELEHVIIDGGSSDGTVEALQAWEKEAGSPDKGYDFRWVSEPDAGLYDALNKGMRMATGDVIGILHTDDVWEEGVLKAVGDVLRTSQSLKSSETSEVGTTSPTDAVYGDLLYVDAEEVSKVRRVWTSGAYAKQKFYQGWMPPHPALFIRREAALRVGDFRLDLGSAADYEWMLRAGLVTGLNMTYLPKTLVRMRVGGASNASVKGRVTAHGHDRRAWEVNGLTPRPWTLKMKVLRKIPQWFKRA
jgi:glycosyltransferase